MQTETTHSAPLHAAPSPSRHRLFAVILGFEALLGVGVRSWYTESIGQHLKLGLDAIWYLFVGGSLAHGTGYSNPGVLFAHNIQVPTANFAPGFPLFIAGLQTIGISSLTGIRLAGAVCGGVTVILTGILGRSATHRASIGLVAGGLVALSPTLIASDASLMSETIAVPITVAVLVAAIWAGRSSSSVRWAVVGALSGALALVRSEDVVVIFVLLPAAVLAAPSVSMARRVGHIAVGVLIGMAVLSPWVIRNLTTFTPTVILSTNQGKTLAGANCPTAYSGPLIGYWDIGCLGHAELANTDEARYNAILDAEGKNYLEHHLSRVPVVVAVRVLRAWGLFHPSQEAQLATLQTRNASFQLHAAWPTSLVVLGLGLPGLVLLRRQRLALVVIAAPIVIATLVVATTFGNPRYVVSATPSLCVASAVTLVWIVEHMWRPRRRSRTRTTSASDIEQSAWSAPISPGDT